MDVLFDQSDLQRLLNKDAEAAEKWFCTYSDLSVTQSGNRHGKWTRIGTENGPTLVIV